MPTATKKSSSKSSSSNEQEITTGALPPDEPRTEAEQKQDAKDIEKAVKNDAPAVDRAEPIKGVHMDQFARRFGNDILIGHFVTITEGEHKGTLGTFEWIEEADENGYPVKIGVRPRNEAFQILIVDAKDVVSAADVSRR